jgi:hypothetical protein
LIRHDEADGGKRLGSHGAAAEKQAIRDMRGRELLHGAEIHPSITLRRHGRGRFSDIFQRRAAPGTKKALTLSHQSLH